MKITFVLPGYPYKPVGGFRIVYLYANYFAQQGHQVSVVHGLKRGSLREPPPMWPKSLRIGWRKILYTTRAFNPPKVRWQSVDTRVKLLYVPGDPVADHVPDGDIVIATAWWTAEYVMQYPPSKGRKFYLIQHWETWAGPEDRVKNTWFLPMTKVVISHWLQDLGTNIGATDVHYIPNAIDLTLFRVTNTMDQRPPAIVALYHAATWKGSHDAIDALSIIHDRYPTVRLTMFGTTRPKKPLPQWLDFVLNPSGETLVALYNAHSIYVSASHAEGWGLPPAEAMACGCAFVGTDIGGHKEFAIHGDTALLSPIQDPPKLAANVSRLIENPWLLRQYQQRGHQNIQQFTWDKSGQAFLNLLLNSVTYGENVESS